MTTKKVRLLEFIVIGVLMGTVEDVIAIVFATDAAIDFRVIFLVFLVAIPFAYISEMVVDHPKFWHNFFTIKSKKSKSA